LPRFAEKLVAQYAERNLGFSFDKPTTTKDGALPVHPAALMRCERRTEAPPASPTPNTLP
jgi:hypothetical protein